MDSILVADDDAAVLGLLRIVASRMGLAVDTASDGAEAWQKLQSKRYLIALIDLMMPRTSGYELLERLKAMQHRPVVIVVTAMGDSHLTGLDPRVVHSVIRKPFDVGMLTAILMDLAQQLKTASSAQIVPFPAQGAD